MSRVFVDTSAVIALLVVVDEFHQAAKSAFAGLSIAQPFLSLMNEQVSQTANVMLSQGRRLGCADKNNGVGSHIQTLLTPRRQVR